MKKLNEELKYVDRSTMVFKIFGKSISLPRDKGFYSDINANGSYSLYRYYPIMKLWTPTPRLIRDCLNDATGENCNHLVANRYMNGNDYIGFHRDKT